MGWVWLAAIGAAAFVALRLLGAPRLLGTFIAAALLLGATGYAWQQDAKLPGHPVTAEAEAIEVDPGLAAFRAVIMPGVADDRQVLTVADNYLRAGDTRAAANVVTQALNQRPRDAALWAGLGGILSAHDDGQVSPAARFAFARAIRLAPDQPGPPFLLGLAFLQAGELPETKIAWLRTLHLTPRDAPWRVDIAERLALIDQFQAMAAGSQPKR